MNRPVAYYRRGEWVITFADTETGRKALAGLQELPSAVAAMVLESLLWLQRIHDRTTAEGVAMRMVPADECRDLAEGELMIQGDQKRLEPGKTQGKDL